jgi:dTDP-4-amino-4,6-dideoxygalactose transaminase
LKVVELKAFETQQASKIPFSLPSRDSAEIEYVLEAMSSNHRHGAGTFTARATEKLREITKAKKILLTHSCTGALELSMLLMDIQQTL